MPDAIPLRDPFAKASPQKEVTRIQWRSHAMQVRLPDLGENFLVEALNEGNRYSTKASKGSFKIEPGAYLLTQGGSKLKAGKSALNNLQLSEFVAPQPHSSDPYVAREPIPEATAGKAFLLKALVIGIGPDDRVTLLINNLSGVWKTLEMKPLGAYTFAAEVPADILSPGLINYRIVVQKGQDEYCTFPGNHKGNPHAWDYFHNESWQMLVAAEKSAIELFNAGKDPNLVVYPNLWRSDERQLITAEKPGQLHLKLSSKDLKMNGHVMGWQHYFADKLQYRRSELAGFKKLVIRARTDNKEAVQLKITFISSDARAHSATVYPTKHHAGDGNPTERIQAG